MVGIRQKVAVAVVAFVMAALAYGASVLAQGRLAAPSSGPVPYTCGTVGNEYKCECGGINDCISLDKSGKCKDAIQDGKLGGMGVCTWTGPSGGGQTAKMLASFGQLAARPSNKRWQCNYGKNHKPTSCTCQGASDCIKLNKSGECGKSEVEQKGSGGAGGCTPS